MRTRQVFCLSLRLPFKQDDLKVRQHSVEQLTGAAAQDEAGICWAISGIAHQLQPSLGPRFSCACCCLLRMSKSANPVRSLKKQQMPPCHSQQGPACTSCP